LDQADPKAQRWLALRICGVAVRRARCDAATAAYGSNVADDIYLTAPDGGLMVMIRPVSGWPWVLAALGVVIVVLGGLLLT
jgi:hypothetical protein